MKLTTPGQTPRARLKHPTLNTTCLTTGHYFIDLRLKAGWAIVPDPQNRLLKEYINPFKSEAASMGAPVAELKQSTWATVAKEAKAEVVKPKRGRPRIKK